MNKRTTTLIIIAILVLLGAVWVYWMATKSSDQLDAGVSVVTDNIDPETGELSRSAQLIRVLENIESIDLSNRSILANPNFNRLQDYGRILEERATGRSNPFAPIGTANLTKSNNTDEVKTQPEVTTTNNKTSNNKTAPEAEANTEAQTEASAETGNTFE